MPSRPRRRKSPKLATNIAIPAIPLPGLPFKWPRPKRSKQRPKKAKQLGLDFAPAQAPES